MYIIYKHTLLLDGPAKGWSYIGLTKFGDKPEARWRNGRGYLKKTADGQYTVFAKAILKYGGKDMWRSNWSHTIIEANIASLDEACERERYWIAFYHTYVNDPYCTGYNMTIGGEGSDGFSHSDATKQKIRQRLHEVFPDGRCGELHPMYGKHLSETHIQRMSEYGRQHPVRYWLGKHRDEQTKKKLSAAQLGRTLTTEERQRQAVKKAETKKHNGTDTATWKSIVQLDTENVLIKIWPNMSAAATELGLKVGNITKVCQHTRNTTGGYKWLYLTEYKNDLSEENK